MVETSKEGRDIVKEVVMRTKEQIRKYKHEWYLKNIELCKQRAKVARLKRGAEAERLRLNLWKKNNREKANLQMQREYYRRYRNDTKYRLSIVLRTRLRSALKKGIKKTSAVGSLGCSLEEFKKYIEKMFKPGMGWDNWSYRGWHLDHKKPISYFDLTNKEELQKALHYTNLQPMWGKENQKKGATWG